ncbi:hypothetical protein F4808DRAFT_120507 [Astrocystis sublimbata]|nr:hypothetical protein F4808DRAFT_120507 [Astrocystis sublimbata]
MASQTSLEKPSSNKEAPATPSDALEKGQEIPTREGPNYVTGTTLYLITVGLSLGLFLVSLEVTIASTALGSISNEFHNFSQSSWIVTAYLLTYTGCLVTWARLSDIYGRKPSCITAFVIFSAFSGVCGGALP